VAGRAGESTVYKTFEEHGGKTPPVVFLLVGKEQSILPGRELIFVKSKIVYGKRRVGNPGARKGAFGEEGDF